MNTAIKYAPKNLDDFVFATPYLKKIVEYYASGASMQPLVLYGTFGSGKSTLAKLIPEAIDGVGVFVNKVKASALNNEKDVFEKLCSANQFDEAFVYEGQSRNYTVIEEVNFEQKASSAFRVALDRMIGKNLIIVTTNKMSSIDRGFFSRAKSLEVPSIPPAIFMHKAKGILLSEGVEIDDETLLDMLDSTYEVHADNRKYFEALDEIIWGFSKR